MTFRRLTSTTIGLCAVLLAQAAECASGQNAPDAFSLSTWAETLKINGFVSGGVALNPVQPYNGLNFGHLYTDRANMPEFNEGLLLVERPLDPNATGIDFGFRLHSMIGTNARYAQFLGQTEYLMQSRVQAAVIEAFGLVHLPVLFPMGVDLQIGQFAGYNGVEPLPSNEALFYTRSYNFNFGPFVDTGIMTISHVANWLDVYAGVITGIDTSIGWPGDNNHSPSVHGGLTLKLLNGDLTIAAFTQSGPENPDMPDPLGVGWPNGVVGGIPAQCVCNPNTTWRFLNDLGVTWKATDRLTFITDISYYRENGWNPISASGLPDVTLTALGNAFGFDPTLIPQSPQGADAYGISQNVAYQLNETVRLAGRVEFWRDNKNFFAGAYPNYFDNVNASHGFPSTTIGQPAGQGTSYLAFTAGATVTMKQGFGPYLSRAVLRPEIRFDTAVNNAAPFFGANGAARSQFLMSMDAILPFEIR